MLVNFCKMHGLGNDFVVIDLITQSFRLHTAHIKCIADRQLGIGCDQVLVLEPPIHKDADFYYRIFNANGQEVEQCGNGARCAARFFYDSGYVNSESMKADCLAGPIDFKIEPHEQVTMTVGPPHFAPKDVPFVTPMEANTYSITLEGLPVEFSVVSFGNPHAVVTVPTIDTAAVKKIGPLLAKHPQFPNQTNVEFMQILDRSNIRLRVWERGVGETMACGTGACAAAVAGMRSGLLDNPVSVQFPHGKLLIDWPEMHGPVTMTGPATSVFIGRFRL
jgi:diaminopimelate epimerase